MRKSASAVAVLALIACGSAYALALLVTKQRFRQRLLLQLRIQHQPTGVRILALQGLLLLLVRKLVLSALLLLVHITQYLLQVKGLRYLVV